MPNTHPVRVRIREITYAKIGTNMLDQPTVLYETAYGPGRPEIDPVTRLGSEADPESEEYQTAIKDFQLGQKVDLLDDDYVRLMNGGAVLDAEALEQAVQAAQENALDVRGASVEELAEWIKSEKPTVNEVVQSSEGSGDLARKLLEAESLATDEDPRKGVVDGLTQVIARD
jgi:hypothetical protein